MSTQECRFNPGHIVEHVRSKNTYVVANTPLNVKIEKTGEPAYIYLDPDTGQLWVRPKTEMEDGRFILLR